ncbi:MAG TPA: hypothetical protein VIH61_07075, partial [Waddliaceae bacterium]
MKILITFILFMLLISCQRLSQREMLVHQIINSHQKSQKKNGIGLIGSRSSIPDEVREFILSYVADRPLEIAEARNLFVRSAEELLTLINSNEQLRPDMANYPFTFDNLDLDISCWDRRGRRFDPPSIGLVFLAKGNICYAFYDNQRRKFIDEIVREPYSEARQIVLGDDASTNCFNI